MIKVTVRSDQREYSLDVDYSHVFQGYGNCLPYGGIIHYSRRIFKQTLARDNARPKRVLPFLCTELFYYSADISTRDPSWFLVDALRYLRLLGDTNIQIYLNDYQLASFW